MRPLVLAAVLAAFAGSGVASGQRVPDPAELAWTNVPLSQALYQLAEATGLELVFALRLVEDVRIYGRYRVTDDPDRALRLLLRGTGVRAERIRAGQYVLIREPPNVTAQVETAREAYTGTLDGRVVDVETGAVLPGAHVWLIDLGLGDVVSADGTFAVPDLPTGRYVVRVSHVGTGRSGSSSTCSPTRRACPRRSACNRTSSRSRTPMSSPAPRRPAPRPA